MPGKLAEGTKINRAFPSERITGATVYYNGYSVTTGAIMTDTKDYDDAQVIINLGTFDGEDATLLNAVYEADSNDMSTATLISGASFTSLNSSSTDDTMAEGAVVVKDTKRYIGLRTEAQGSIAMTIDFSAVTVLGKADKKPVSKTLDFDV